MEDYTKIIESLGITFVSVVQRGLIKPVTITGYQDLNNSLILVEKGTLSFEDHNSSELSDGDLLFIPGTKSVRLSYGEKGESIAYDKFSSNINNYFKENSVSATESNISLKFEAKLFDAISYFSSLDIPPFAIKGNDKIATLLKAIVEEQEADRAGKDRVTKILTERIVVEVIRYILENKLFLEQLATNTTYFKDPRLIDIFKYIKENLSGDLSNKVLSNVANVSEDYVGQYFKMLTGINPQDYIEYQRMERAVYLLRTTKKSVRDIGTEVGYKDTAYFCRRFKMMFGIPAGKMRRRDKVTG